MQWLQRIRGYKLTFHPCHLVGVLLKKLEEEDRNGGKLMSKTIGMKVFCVFLDTTETRYTFVYCLWKRRNNFFTLLPTKQKNDSSYQQGTNLPNHFATRLRRCCPQYNQFVMFKIKLVKSHTNLFANNAMRMIFKYLTYIILCSALLVSCQGKGILCTITGKATKPKK